MFHGLHELAGFEERIVGAGVQPSDATPHETHCEAALAQIAPVQIRYFQFAASGGFEGRGHPHHVVVVEIEAGDGMVGGRVRRLLHDVHRLAVFVAHHPEAMRLSHLMCEHRGARVLRQGIAHHARKVRAKEDVVAQDERHRVLADEGGANAEGVRQPAWRVLRAMLDGDTPLAAVAEQLPIAGLVVRR